MATAACRASSAAGASCSGSSIGSSSGRSSSFRRVVAAVSRPSSSSSSPSLRRPLSRLSAPPSPIPSVRAQAMGIGLGEEVGEVPTGRRIVLPGEEDANGFLHHGRRAASFHSSPLLDPDFDVPKSHYGLTLKQMESLGLHEHALLNGSPDPVSR